MNAGNASGVTPGHPSGRCSAPAPFGFKRKGITTMPKQPTPVSPRARNKIIVGSKLPMSIELQLFNMVEQQRTFRGTAWVEIEAQRVGAAVTIRGTSYPRGIPPTGFISPPQIVHGYSLTYGVDAEWFEQWLAQNKTTDIVKNNMLIWGDSREDVADQAIDLAKLASGLDPVTPPFEGQAPSDRDPRLPRPVPGLAFSGTPGLTDADTSA
jgi:hypothetical protein